MAPTFRRNDTAMTWPQQVGLILLIILGWLTCTAAVVEKYVPLRPAAFLCFLGCIFVAIIMTLLRWSYRRGLDIPRWSLVALFAVLVLSFAFLYPKSLHHDELRKGSDREDALRVELVAVTHNQYPYNARTFRNNPPTPLPGALWLASPFFFLGRIALQNLVWTAAFIVFLCRFFRRRSTVFAFVVLFLLTAFENLQDFVVGGDYITNFIYISIAVFLFTHTVERRRIDWLGILSVILLGVALSSRVIYMVVLFPLLAFTWQRTSLRRTVILFAGVLAVAAMATLPVFSPHPISRLLAQLGQNHDKFQALPAYLPGELLPPIALFIASVSFFVPVNLSRIYLISGVATLVMLLPPMAGIVAAEGGLSRPLNTNIEYLAVSVLFIGLWIFSRWEQHLPSPSEESLEVGLRGRKMVDSQK